MAWEKDEADATFNKSKPEDIFSNSASPFDSDSIFGSASSFGPNSLSSPFETSETMESGYSSSPFETSETMESGYSLSPFGVNGTFGADVTSLSFGSGISFGSGGPSNSAESNTSSNSAMLSSGSGISFGSGSSSSPAESNTSSNSATLSSGPSCASSSADQLNRTHSRMVPRCELVSTVFRVRPDGTLPRIVLRNHLRQLNATLQVDQPDIHLTISSLNMEELEKFYKKHKSYNKIIIILFCASLSCTLTTCLGDEDTRGIIGIIGILVFTAAIVVMVIFCTFVSKNKKEATALFKNEFVRRELTQYISNINVQENEYIYTENPPSTSDVDDLTNAPSVESAIQALGLINSQCNENHVKEWMSAIYHGTRFIFFEITLLNVYYTGKRKSKQMHEQTIYDGQGYIFNYNPKTRMSFAIQYILNSDCKDFTIANFYNVFSAYKCNMASTGLCLAAKETLVDEERKLFNWIETNEFKVCLLKLAKLFHTQLREQPKPITETPSGNNKLGKNESGKDEVVENKFSVRLQNKNIIILREGSFDYFEINLDQNMDSEIDKLSKELSEFVSVLETVGDLPQVSKE